MQENDCWDSRKEKYGFGLDEINKIKRLLLLSRQPIDQSQQKMNRVNFYRFFRSCDERRKTNFVKTFPELKDFWFYCKELSDDY